MAVPLLVALWVGAGLLTILGMLLLRWPVTWQAGQSVTWGQAIFVAVSAICTAGLAPVDIATTWNRLGQAVLVVLVAIGGVGYVATATLLLAGIMRRTIVYEAHHVLGMRLGEEQLGELRPLLRRLLLATAVIQLAGFLALLVPSWRAHADRGEAVWWAFATAVTAFHNAGFDFEPGIGGFATYQRSPLVLLPIALLVLLGATGFPALSDVVARRSWRRLYPDTRLVLLTTAALSATGIFGIWLLERANPATLGGLPWPQQLLDAFALTVSRTGGPRVVETRMLSEETSFLLGALTFIGGASGSVAGGVKLQTFSLLLLAIFATVRGSRHVVAFGREVPHWQVFRALAIAVFALVVTFAGTVALAAQAPYDLPVTWLLVVQAFGLAGAESQLVAGLGAGGQATLVLLMVLGRFGPLVLALAFATHVQRELVHYAPESVRLG
ncbi:MAG: potassium transporter TrkG [Thermomicrobium sp.]|nr:potassium transporter TrkG [Thermomicrobium sp.]